MGLKDDARSGYAQRKLTDPLALAQIRQHHAEQRALGLADELADTRTALLETRRASVAEPLTYRRGGEHSFFLDVARARRRSIRAARDRLARHEREMEAELPKRQQARARAAQAAYEAAFYSTPEDRRAMDAMLAAGASPFETRAMTRTDGQGGYLTPPVYLMDEYVPFTRAGAPFASRWHDLPLPPSTSEINVPRLALGTATGPQADASAAASRDITDSLVSAPVRTVAGIADVSLQWLEQGGGLTAGRGVDEMIYADLTADIAQNTDGQALLGTGTGSQILGVWPGGSIAAASGIVQADTTATVWTAAAGTASLHVNAAQTVSLARRIRNRPDGWAWYWHPWAWSLYTAQVDLQDRPLVNCQCGDLPAGVLGYYQNLPVIGDANIPTTFGGTQAPQMGAITNGQYAALTGTGTGASYTPLLLARADDLYMFAGEIRLQLLTELLSGSGQARFQAVQYLAATPNRYVAAAAVGSSVSAGGDVAHATLTSQHAGSLLILSGSGY